MPMLTDFWTFLSAPENQATLAFVGGGVMVAASGLWTAFLYLRGSKPPETPVPAAVRPAASREVHARSGSVAVGGNMTVSGPVAIQQLPKSLLALGVLGLLLLGFAIWHAGDRITVRNGNHIGRDMTNSKVIIQGGSGQ